MSQLSRLEIEEREAERVEKEKAKREQREQRLRDRRDNVNLLEDRGDGAWRVRENLRSPGELKPMQDADNVRDALKVALTWVKALGLDMKGIIRPGITL